MYAAYLIVYNNYLEASAVMVGVWGRHEIYPYVITHFQCVLGHGFRRMKAYPKATYSRRKHLGQGAF